MPVYRFGSDILLPYMRETERDRKPRTRETEAQCARRLMEFFGEAPISHGKRGKLNGSMVRAYREQRKLTVKAESAKRELALAARACSYAISEWDFDMPNPFHGRLMSEKDRTAKRRIPWRVLTRPEEARLLLAADPYARDVIQFALATGLRQSEILGLTWNRIHGDIIEFTAETQKANRDGIRALSDTALAVLARQIENGPYVFHTNGLRINRHNFHNRHWNPARVKAGIPDFKFHWLRKTCGQRLLDATGSITVVQHQLGHAESRTTERVYTRESADVLRAGLRAVENQL